MRVLAAGGSPREIGRTIGAEAGDLVRRAIDLICRFDASPGEVDARLAAAEAVLAEAFPATLEEAEGIAEGAGLSRRDVLSLSLCSELSGRLPSYCSLAAVPAAGGTLVGKNLDTTLAMGPLQVVERIEPEAGLEFVHVTTAGAMWTDGGVNEEGLAVVNASLAPARSEPGGVPDGILARELLRECADVPAAVAMLETHEVRTLGENILLADAAGRAAVVEKLPGAQAVREADGRGSLVACNHALLPDLAERMASDDEIRDSSVGRLARLEEERRRTAEWTSDGIRDLLRDPRRGVRQTGGDGLWTVATFLLTPAARRLVVLSEEEEPTQVTLGQPTPAPGGAG